jgi:preprotein translocase subunit SecG
MFLLLVTAIFLIVLVLIQRGKGGGLAGALGGMGGQSAFGTKAGDLFTRITIGLATFWILLCIVAIKYYGGAASGMIGPMGGDAVQQGTSDSGDKPASEPSQKPAEGEKSEPSGK